MSSMPFLPQKFSRSEKQSGPHFPTDNVRPLVDQNGQIPVGLDPVPVRIPNDGFGRGAYDQFLFEFGFRIYYDAFPIRIVHQPVMGDYGAFLGETFYVGRLLAEKGFGDKKRKIGIDVAGFFEHPVELVSDVLPDGKTIGSDDHASPDG